jgi:hypothetical protein
MGREQPKNRAEQAGPRPIAWGRHSGAAANLYAYWLQNGAATQRAITGRDSRGNGSVAARPPGKPAKGVGGLGGVTSANFGYRR